MDLLKKLDELDKRFAEINEMVQDPDLVKDQKKYKDVMREHGHLSDVLEVGNEYSKCLSGIEDAKMMITAEDDPDMKEMAREEMKELEEKVPVLEEQIKLKLIPPDPLDEKNIILEIRSAAGGDEASLFVRDMWEMYCHLCERKGWKYENLEAQETEVGGFNKIVTQIQGKFVFGTLRWESGVHRVQRVPQTESQGRLQTSTVTVAVLPEAEEADVKINPGDVRVDVMRAGGPGGQCVNTTDFQQSKLDAERSAARKSMVGNGDRSEKIRTYNYPQDRVTDHRINLTLHNLPSFMMGNMDEMLDALNVYAKEEQFKELEA